MGNELTDFVQRLSEVHKTKISFKTTPYNILDIIGVGRRGWRVVERVNKLFDEHDVISVPEFGDAWIYADIEIKPRPKIHANKSSNETSEIDKNDPTPRLSLLKAANINIPNETNQSLGLISVKLDTKLSEAITFMILHDFSQLPILSDSRTVKGMVSWKSIGRAFALGNECITVNDCKEDIFVLKFDEPLFTAVKYILEKEVVLVKQHDNSISGIITVTDIGEQFIALAEPFLLIEQIENHIRKLLDDKFSIVELKESINKDDKGREIKSLSDLTFGEYVKIIENPKHFEKLNLKIDSTVIAKQLEEVRKIRNDVMHFDPDGITQKELELLRETAQFFQTISAVTKNNR